MAETVFYSYGIDGGGSVLVTDQNITVTFGDGATATIPNLSYTNDDGLQSNGEVLISNDANRFHATDSRISFDNALVAPGNVGVNMPLLLGGANFLPELKSDWVQNHISDQHFFAAIRDNPAPDGYNQFNEPVQDFQVTVLLGPPFAGGNPVFHRIFEDQNILVNVTLPGHQFHGSDLISGGRPEDGGVVFRHSYIDENGVRQTQSVGFGTGAQENFNEFFGPIVWEANTAVVHKGAVSHVFMTTEPWFMEFLYYEGSEEDLPAALAAAIEEQLAAGLITPQDVVAATEALGAQWGALALQALAVAGGGCFLAGTQIDMWPEGLRARADGTYDPAEVRAQSWKKPIEEVAAEDWVVSFDKSGNLVPGRVTRTFRKDVAIVLDFWGTGVTPGHVFYRPDSKRPEKFETLIDILRDDGIVQNAQGQAIRAATGQPVGGPLDGFVWVVTGNRLGNGLAVIRDKRKLRLGTRLINTHGQDVCIGDLIADGGGMVTEEGWVRAGDAEMPFQWTFSDSLPNPEDYILARSGTTLEDIFRAAEWEAERPQMPPPMVRDGGRVQPLSEPARAAMPRNTPMAMRGGAAGINRKARRAAAAKARTKAKWLH
jgi:hypothetical protein